jgi:hypothetical protein
MALAFAALSVATAQDLPENTQRQIGALLAEKASRNPAQAKMDSHLVHAATILRGQPMNPDMPSLQGELEAVRRDANNFVEVDIRAAVNPDLLALIRSLGGTVVNQFPQYESVRARLPLLSVERVAERSEVRQIRVAAQAYVNAAPAVSPTRAGFAARARAVRAQLAAFLAAHKSADLPAPALGSLLRSLGTALSTAPPEGPDSNGDKAHQADIARANFNFDGTGVKVGVVSNGVDSLAGEQAKGNLPSSLTVVSGQAGGGDEGTAMLEIVHTLAPGATLYFATGATGESQMASNIQALAAAGCNVIVDDVVYPTEGVYQDDVIAQAVNSVTAGNNVFYYSSAGNAGNAQAGASGTWEGDFVDSGTTLAGITAAETGVYTIHRFGATNYNTLTQPSSLVVGTNNGFETGVYELKWSDALGQSNNDYDLFITDSSGNVLGSSTNTQNGTQDPEEDITGSSAVSSACTPAAGSLGTCRIIIVKHASAAPRTLYLDTERGRVSIATNGATFGHSAAANTFTVAATDAYYGNASGCTGFSAACNGPVEYYSSDGPRRMFYNPDGSAITSNNFLIGTGGGTKLAKPDMTAADGAYTGLSASSGYNPFYGTSAAAPHAAAIAALVVQALPTMTPSVMHAAFASNTVNAIAISGAAPNVTAGDGIVMAPGAIESACGYSVSSLTGVAGAGGNVKLTIQAAGVCPWTITGLPSWISGATSGKGNAAVTLTVAANSGASRTASFSLQAGTLALASGSITQTSGAPPLTIATSAVMLSGFVTGSYSQDLTASGGASPYTWSLVSGSLPPGLALAGAAIAGTPTGSGGTFTFTLKVTDSAAATATQQFTLTVVSGTGLARVGVLSHFAAGGSWDTTIWIVNTSASSVPVRLVFHSDDGTTVLKATGTSTPTPTALTATQQGDVQTGITATTLDRVVNPNTGLLVGCGLGQAVNVEGWIDVLAAAAGINGFAVFRYAPNGLTPTGNGYFTPYEGTVPLQTQLAPATLTLPFDNTSGFNNGVAIGTLSGSAVTFTATFYDINGGSTLGAPQTFTLPANGHTAFLLYSQFPGTANQKGSVVFSGGTPVIGLGLRASSYGTLTSVPVILQ